MEIKILGTGCVNSNKLEANTKRAIHETGLHIHVEMVTDFDGICSFGVVKTPALVIDGKVVVGGRVADCEEIKAIVNGFK
ncbi:MAG: thioredoxin family protein [Eubacteriaceae bacterium]|nr:thioredoxin family protein [Eubacteriaceae bacterium]